MARSTLNVILQPVPPCTHMSPSSAFLILIHHHLLVVFILFLAFLCCCHPLLLTHHRLQGLNFAVFGLGNRTYEQFNEVGKYMDKAFAALGGSRVCPLGEGDDNDDIEEDFSKWCERFWADTCTKCVAACVLFCARCKDNFVCFNLLGQHTTTFFTHKLKVQSPALSIGVLLQFVLVHMSRDFAQVLTSACHHVVSAASVIRCVSARRCSIISTACT